MVLEVTDMSDIDAGPQDTGHKYDPLEKPKNVLDGEDMR